MTLAPFLGLPFPLLAVQILWINLITDGLPALALGVEPTERGTMHRPPRSPSESLFARGLWQHTIWVGLLMASVALAVQAYAVGQGWPWQTMIFATLALLQLGNALAIRSETDSLFARPPIEPALDAGGGGHLVVQMASSSCRPCRSSDGRADAAPAGTGPGCVHFGFAAVEAEKWVRRRTSGMATAQHFLRVARAKVTHVLQAAQDTAGAQGDPLARLTLALDVDPCLAVVGVLVPPATAVVLLRQQPRDGTGQTRVPAIPHFDQRLEDLEDIGHVARRESELEPGTARPRVAPAHRVVGYGRIAAAGRRPRFRSPDSRGVSALVGECAPDRGGL